MADITGTSQNDTLSGTLGDDRIFGLAGDDYLIANAGDNTLDGGAGADTLEGALFGEDIYISAFSEFDGDFLSNYEDNEQLIFTDVTFSASDITLTYGPSSTTVTIDAPGGKHGTIQFEIAGLQHIESLTNTGGGTILTFDAGAAITGTAGSDTIHADNVFAGDDTIFGLGGDDSLYGYGGNDILYGGDGEDYIEVGVLSTTDNFDTVHGGAGNDLIQASRGADLIYGDQGNDTIQFDHNGLDGDTIYGGDGDDWVHFGSNRYNFDSTIVGGSGDDTVSTADARGLTLQGVENLEFLTTAAGNLIHGSNGTDIIDGLGGNDTLHGEGGVDKLIGDLGDDQLYGGDGDDILSGDAGDDTLQGDAGADTFVFEAGMGHDVVADFSSGDGDLVQVQSSLLAAGTTEADLVNALEKDGNGNTFLKFSGTETVTFVGVAPVDFSASDFLIY